ncbi:MAG: NAD(P)H-dependent oxidoreductase [Myxococcales bacterium]|nr:NAD(P)H-dependent oxidoreductase [Myxococcales bacterium]MCB9531966.1 NAD(P)H-dependent oxidoreductase [Myxococcales bacterium]MCB9532821.1 NAD(P)H-dependent oxidoreductase [Myxococcales bacterium]
MKYLVVSSSLSPTSKSRVMARSLVESVQGRGANVELLDLCESPLPFCDAASCYGDPGVARARAAVEAADGIVLATPIYNYTIGAAAKNLVELTGKAWSEKVVAFLCAAGGPHSYMSVMGLASSLMLDFRVVVVPRFVYATGKAFAGGELVDAEVADRIAALGADWIRMTEAIRSAG